MTARDIPKPQYLSDNINGLSIQATSPPVQSSFDPHSPQSFNDALISAISTSPTQRRRASTRGGKKKTADY